MADCVFLTTQDQLHRDPAVAFAQKGYHILLEKPMAVTENDCRDIYNACLEAGVMLSVCHVLRNFPPVMKIKQLINSGIIGEVCHISHIENVGFWHFAHSYVRGKKLLGSQEILESRFVFKEITSPLKPTNLETLLLLLFYAMLSIM